MKLNSNRGAWAGILPSSLGSHKINQNTCIEVDTGKGPLGIAAVITEQVPKEPLRL